MTFTKDFIRLLEKLHSLRDCIIWLPLSKDDTEEYFYKEICTYIKEYENSRNIGMKVDVPVFNMKGEK